MAAETYRTESNTSPIFVVGAPRSGTTLVARILGRSPEVFSPGESHYFEDVWNRRQELGKLQESAQLALAVGRVMTLFRRFDSPGTQDTVNETIKEKALIARTRALGGGYGALYLAFMSMLAESVGKKRFCDDTPKHLYYLDTIFALFPSAKVIGCLRDPRDFLSSYKYHWQTLPSEESGRIKALYHPVLTSLLWRSSMNLLRQYADQGCSSRVLLVRYEQLVARPRQQVRRICDFLEIGYSDALIQVETHNSSFEGAESRGIFTSSVGRWRTRLAAEEAWWVQCITRRNMLALGYEAERVKPATSQLLRTAFSAPLALVRALRVNARRRGPLLKYIWVRLLAVLRAPNEGGAPDAPEKMEDTEHPLSAIPKATRKL